jgi:hypothetical protein
MISTFVRIWLATSRAACCSSSRASLSLQSRMSAISSALKDSSALSRKATRGATGIAASRRAAAVSSPLSF